MKHWEWMGLAHKYSCNSKDPRKKVGCVIVNDDRLIGWGWNRFPKGIKEDHRMLCKETKNNIILHAEQTALEDADKTRIKGATLYCTTKPCERCSCMIIDYGIKTVVAPKYKGGSWATRLDFGLSLLEEAGIRFIEL